MKIKVLVDVSVECDPPRMYGYGKTQAEVIESQAKQLQRWADEFNEFIRDHRSRDDVSLSVNRKYEDQCSHCGYTWELDDEGVPVCCDKAITEHEAAKSVGA